jgi:hypothetical protein
MFIGANFIFLYTFPPIRLDKKRRAGEKTVSSSDANSERGFQYIWHIKLRKFLPAQHVSHFDKLKVFPPSASSQITLKFPSLRNRLHLLDASLARIYG